MVTIINIVGTVVALVTRSIPPSSQGKLRNLEDLEEEFEALLQAYKRDEQTTEDPGSHGN